MAGNPAPGFKQHPAHRVDLARDGKRVRVSVAGVPLADSRDAITVKESGYGPVFYLPRKDVDMTRLSRTDRHTTCPFKGEASYYSITGAGGAVNAVWSYETPYDEVLELKERLAFYPDKVEIKAE